MAARDYKPGDVINPNIADRREYIADPDGLVNAETKRDVNRLLYNLRQKTSTEVVMAIVPNTGDLTEEDFATELFSSWGVGKRDKDNGVLILIVPEQRAARIATGYGVEGVLPDISARKMIERSVVPYMRKNDLDGAVATVAVDMANVLSSPQAAEELKSGQPDSWDRLPESDITGEDIIAMVLWLAILIFLFSCGMYVFDSRRLGKQERYQQALGWHNKLNSYLILAVSSLGIGFIPYLLARRKYNRSRNKPMNCPTCRGKMKKLNEEKDNLYLNPAQDLEEKLNTVDYDVWICPDCGTIERYPFRTRQMDYEECPVCHTVAMRLIRDHTVVTPTVNRSGSGERIYECKYCHNRTHRKYTIPPKTDGRAAALAAGAILGSGRGGGGGFGGGFGGGRTGGGGATGRW